MASDPKARKMMISYPKGTVTMSIGLWEYIFGTQVKLQWQRPYDEGSSAAGRKIMKYGRRQRSLAAGGRLITFVLDNGEAYTARITGEDNDFIDWFLTRTPEGKVLWVYTERGTKYGPQFPESNV